MLNLRKGKIVSKFGVSRGLLKKKRLEDVNLPGQNKLFSDKSICPYYKVLWYKSKKLYSFGEIFSFIFAVTQSRSKSVKTVPRCTEQMLMNSVNIFLILIYRHRNVLNKYILVSTEFIILLLCCFSLLCFNFLEFLFSLVLLVGNNHFFIAHFYNSCAFFLSINSYWLSVSPFKGTLIALLIVLCLGFVKSRIQLEQMTNCDNLLLHESKYFFVYKYLL